MNVKEDAHSPDRRCHKSMLDLRMAARERVPAGGTLMFIMKDTDDTRRVRFVNFVIAQESRWYQEGFPFFEDSQ